MSEERSQLIEKKARIVTQQNVPVKINRLISDKGGQGDVFHVTMGGKDYAMKWYCTQPCDVIGGSQFKTIQNIYGEKKQPDRTDAKKVFVWPLYMVAEDRWPENDAAIAEAKKQKKRFGYLMELVPEGFYEMEDFLRMDDDARKQRFAGWNASLLAGMNIAEAMKKLHLMGYSYKDLNPKNFMFQPQTGDVLVVDNDNVSVNEDPCSVRGMKGYMAPEIPRTNMKMIPDRYTDFYSLAVILYRLFLVDHPMEGRMWSKMNLCNDESETYMYSIKPVFHFDPKNDSNRPDDVYAPNAAYRWNHIIPEELRSLFTLAFTAGIDQREKRIIEGTWVRALEACRERLIRISGGKECFVEFGNPSKVPPRCLGLKINKHMVALYPQKAIYQGTLNDDDRCYDKIAGGILYDPGRKVFMIRNLTKGPWRGRDPLTKTVSEIAPGKDYPIVPGTRIEFSQRPQVVGEVFDALKPQ